MMARVIVRGDSEGDIVRGDGKGDNVGRGWKG